MNETNNSNNDKGLDKISVNQNVLLAFEDREAGSDLLVMPIELNTAISAKIRPGHFMKYGLTQEVKVEYGGTKIKARECQSIKKENQIGYGLFLQNKYRKDGK